MGLRYTRIIYVESFARVNSLSLSGKLLKRFVDTFVVQWPEAAGDGEAQVIDEEHKDKLLEKRQSRVQYRGWLV